MKTLNVIHNQNLFDLAIEKQGNVCAVFQMAFENNMSVSDVLAPGITLELKANTPEYNVDVSTYYARKQQQVATDNLSAINNYIFTQTLQFIL